MRNQITRRNFIKISSAAATGLLIGCSMNKNFDLIIQNGLVFDGTGQTPQKVDIGILGDKITAMGNLQSVNAEQIIKADNLAVSPGFIDIHTHTDTELLINPNAESKIRQGITTEVSGNCGYAPFPLSDGKFTELDDTLFKKYQVHVTWKDIGGFLEALEQKGISLNYATFTGHGTLRGFAIGYNDVQPDPGQLNQMKKLLAEEMEKGSLGLSTGLEYAPGSYAKTEELIELSKVVSAKNGVYASHIRNEDDRVEEAVEEALRICREANVSVQISHLKACNRPNWHKIDGILENIQKSSGSGLPVHADRYPYTAWSTGLEAMMPLWSRQGSTDEMLARLTDKTQFAKIRNYMELRGENIGGWDRLVINSCYTDANKIYEGKSIKECASLSGKPASRFIRDLLIEEKSRVNIMGFAMDEDNLKKVLASPLVMVGSDGSATAPYGKLGEGKPHPRYYGTFPRVLGKYSRDEKIFDLSTAVKKMTSMPAEKLGLPLRGKLAKGYHADVVIFDPQKVKDEATFQSPHRYPAGIDYVIVNGKIVIADCEHTGNQPGRILREV